MRLIRNYKQTKGYTLINILFLTFFLLANMSVFAQNSVTDIEFVPVQSYATTENGVFFSGSFSQLLVTSDEENNLYILDEGTSLLMAFDKNGNLNWQTGQSGRGPGDFDRPNGMIYSENSLLISNQNGSRLDKVNLSGEHVRSYNIDNFGRLVKIQGATENGQLVFATSVFGMIGLKIIIAELAGDDLTKVNEFDVNLAPEIDMGFGLSSSNGLNVIGSKLAVGNVASYEIPFYNTSGQKLQTLKKTPDLIVRPGFKNSGGSRSIMVFSSVGPPVKLKDGLYLNRAIWPVGIDDPDSYISDMNLREGPAPKIKNEKSIDLFDSQGNLIFSKEYKNGEELEIGSILYADNEGYIYTRTRTERDEPQLTKFRVVIKY